MRFYTFLFTFALLIIANMTTASDTYKESEKPMIILENMYAHISKIRQQLEHLTDDNTKVIDQFDAFAETLVKTYIAGEGFIYKDIHRVLDAVSFAAEKHRFQKRKNPTQTPYIIHPIGVAYTLLTLGKVRDPDILMGALLHDTVEDTETSFKEIEEKFGSRVTGFVKEVTDDKSLSKRERKQLQIDHAPDKSAGAAQIKLSDKLYNLTDLINSPPDDWEEERVDEYFGWAKKVVDHLPWVNVPLKNSVDQVIESYWQDQESE